MKQMIDYLTEFVFCERVPQKADYIMIPGSGYGELSLKAAELYHQGYADQIIISGKYSKLLDRFAGAVSPQEYVGRSFRTEAELHCQILLDQGVKQESVIKEEEATFTYENALYIRKLLQERYAFDPEKEYKVLLVSQAFHAKRSLMYFQYVFPNVTFFCCPAVTQGISKDNWFLTEKGRNTVLGEVERCGIQFKEMINGTDKVWKEILG